MKQMGYDTVNSLKTGLKGWNEYDPPLFNDEDEMNLEAAEAYHIQLVSDDPLEPEYLNKSVQPLFQSSSFIHRVSLF